MKKFISFVTMIMIATISMAQWEVASYDNGFDKTTYYGYASVDAETWCYDIDRNDNLEKHHISAELVKFNDTPVLIFDYFWFRGFKHKDFQDVIITFKVNGVDKRYNVAGIRIGWKKLVISTDSIIDNISKVMQGQFLSDFKNASKMKIEIKNCDDVYVDDVFNMRGSTNAYNKVKNLNNDYLLAKHIINDINELIANKE